MANILSSKALVQTIKDQLIVDFKNIKNPTLTIIQVGSDSSSNIYVEKKSQFGLEIGVKVEIKKFEEGTSEDEIIKEIQSTKEKRSGVIVQSPLPKGYSLQKICEYIPEQLDVDCMNPTNLGKLLSGNKKVIPGATVSSVLKILDFCNVDLMGKNVVIINSSIVLGKPLAMILVSRGATVTIAHSKSDVPSLTTNADVLITATGKKHLVKASMVKLGAVVIDVGISYVEGRIYGDVDTEEVAKVASIVTKVPGGVGPLTVACLFENLYLLLK